MHHYSVLVIDDDEEIRRLFNHILKDEGYDIYDSIDGQDTVEILNTIHPDLLLLDLTMPRMDGFECLKKIRDSGFQEPIVVITGRSEDGVEETVMRLGATEFLEKPVRPEVLLKVVKDTLEDSKNNLVSLGS